MLRPNPKMEVFSILAKNSWKIETELFRSALFHLLVSNVLSMIVEYVRLTRLRKPYCQCNFFRAKSHIKVWNLKIQLTESSPLTLIFLITCVENMKSCKKVIFKAFRALTQKFSLLKTTAQRFQLARMNFKLLRK